MRIEELAAKAQARIDSADQSVVGVNKYQSSDEAPINILKVDNTAVQNVQLEKLKHLRANRDPQLVQDALDALTRAAGGGNANLLELAVDAARAPRRRSAKSPWP